MFGLKIKAKYINYSSLSMFEPLEKFPIYYKQLSNVCVLSEVALNNVKSTLIDFENVTIFPNYATKEYFEFNGIKRNNKLKKICIISNHIPNELFDCSNILKENSYNVDIYGLGYNQVLITPYILKKYDLVISIGKSVQYALSMGIPCYNYDCFGGDLYITANNIKISFEDNFSGRSLSKKLNKDELYYDIINNYQEGLNSVNSNKQFAKKYFSLENNMKKILMKINHKVVIDFKKLYRKFSELELYCTTFSKEIYNRNVSVSRLQSQLIELTSTINNKDNLIDSQNNFINNNVLEKNNLKNKIDILEKDNEYLKAVIIELQQRIKGIETSIFWKILQPVRKIYKYFKNKK